MFKILMVDDDQDLVYIVKLVLEKDGFEVQTAADGDQALRMIKTFVPDLMIVDLTMPEMDGWRLSMKVRQNEKLKNIPIIVLSGLLAQEESKPAPNEPFDVLLGKPFDILKLKYKIKCLLAAKED